MRVIICFFLPDHEERGENCVPFFLFVCWCLSCLSRYLFCDLLGSFALWRGVRVARDHEQERSFSRVNAALFPRQACCQPRTRTRIYFYSHNKFERDLTGWSVDKHVRWTHVDMPGATTDTTWSKEEDLAIMVQADERGGREWVKVRSWLFVCLLLLLSVLTDAEPELKNAA